MIDLNKEGNPNKASNILNELKGMEIWEAQELLDWCKQKLLHQPSCSWSIRINGDHGVIKADCE